MHTMLLSLLLPILCFDKTVDFSSRREAKSFDQHPICIALTQTSRERLAFGRAKISSTQHLFMQNISWSEWLVSLYHPYCSYLFLSFLEGVTQRYFIEMFPSNFPKFQHFSQPEIATAATAAGRKLGTCNHFGPGLGFLGTNWNDILVFL